MTGTTHGRSGAVSADSGFEGFAPAAIQFLADLAEHNERAWFQPRKAEYERLLKRPMAQLCVAVAERFVARDMPLLSDPVRSPFRIYRDTRFSRDKSPYKTHLAATFPWIGDSDTDADGGAHANGGYFNFQPGEMYLGGGVWMPHKERLAALRAMIRDDPERVRAAIDEPGFAAVFGEVRSHESLKRIPPGFPVDHPMADMFRWKDMVFGRPLGDDEVTAPTLPDTIADGLAAAMPVLRLLNSLG